MSIKLLALDLDGTLLNSQGELSTGNLAAIKRARAIGVTIALVTGRRFRDARLLALEVGVDAPLISHNGALTKHAHTLRTVSALLLPVETALAVLDVATAFDACPMVSDDSEGMGLLVYESLSHDHKEVSSYLTWSRRVLGEDSARGAICVPSLKKYLDHSPVHIGFSGTCAGMISLAKALKQELGHDIRVLRTSYPSRDFALVDVVNPNASKGAGLQAVARELSIERKHVMAIGDNFNDIEMLEYAGTGVVMANADPELRNSERFEITASNDEDGVALAIERLILKTL